MTKTDLENLSEASRKWIAEVRKLYTFQAQHEALLLTCGRCLDRITEARQQVAQEGSYFTDKHGIIRAHPGLKVERDSQNLLNQTLKLLDILDEETPKLPIRGHQPRRGVR